MNTNLLYIPFRQSERIPIAEELAALIKRDYYQTPSTFQADLELVKQHREGVYLKNETATKDDISRLQQYYNTLSDIAGKFRDDQVEFCWYGTLGYSRTAPQTTRSFLLEKLNVLYQLGSLYSQLALAESLHSSEGLKNACFLLQRAAGYYERVIQQVDAIPHNTPAFQSLPGDFHMNTLYFLRSVMLSQAQETVWLKAISNDDSKPSVIAKLLIETAKLYAAAADYGAASRDIKLDWVNHVTVKRHHFNAAAHLRYSQLCQDTYKYGDQVAHLKIAAKSCDLALKAKSYVNKFVIEDLNGLNTMVKDTLRAAEKDNDLVYLQPVPDERDLAPIIGVSMVKPIVEEISNNAETSVFKELLPYQIVQIAQSLRERQDDYTSLQIALPIHALNKMISKFLSERELPSSIDSIQKPESVPESITRHAQEIISIGGLRLVDDSLNEIEKLAIRCSDIIEACEERLRIEADEDDMLRARLGPQNWGRPTSQEAAASLVERIETMKAYYNQAENGDLVVVEEYLAIKPFIKIFCGTHNELSKFIPNSNFVKLDPVSGAIITDLRSALNEVDNLESKRKRFLANLEVRTRNHNILPKIIGEYKRNKGKYPDPLDVRSFEPFYNRHVEFFADDVKFVEEQKQQQIRLEQQIDALNVRFHAEVKSQSQLQLERQEALQVLESAHAKYLELIYNLNEGSKFYSDFIASSKAVLDDCDRFLYSRRMEGRELESSTRTSQDTILQPQEESPEANNVAQHMHSNIVSPQTRSSLWDPSQGIRFE